MSAVAIDHLPRWTAPALQGARAVLFGTGTVGSALLARCRNGSTGSPRTDFAGQNLPVRGEPVEPSPHRHVHIVHTANTRHRIDAHGNAHAPGIDATIAALGRGGRRIVIDATTSDALAARHAGWLARGLHVVTACKLGQGASLERWRAIRAACAASGASYGDAATVGAGLPILRTLREALAAGDTVRAVAGVLSGSLGWILSHYDGTRAFADLVAEAQARGYTEPDPRQDLSGEDVSRKLLIVARTAGRELDAADVPVQSLADFGDAEIARARRKGHVLRYLARLDANGARAGLESLAPDDPLAQGSGCDNRVAIWTDRYRDRPIVIQGPGAGADVTAGALLEDVLRIARTA